MATLLWARLRTAWGAAPAVRGGVAGGGTGIAFASANNCGGA
jgi:hypothetical protein